MEFVRALQDQKTTKIPSTVEFECEVNRSDFEVTWTKGSKVIRVTDEEKYSIEKEGATHRLVVKNVDGRDVGEYSATCRNKSTEAKLMVEGRWSINFYFLYIYR